MNRFILLLAGAIAFSLQSFALVSTWDFTNPDNSTLYEGENAKHIDEADSTWGVMSPGTTYVITPSGFKEPPGPGEGAGVTVSSFRFVIRGTPDAVVTVMFNMSDAFSSEVTNDSLLFTNWVYNLDWPGVCPHCEGGPIYGDSLRLPIFSGGTTTLFIAATVAVPTEAIAGKYSAEITASYESTPGTTTDTLVKRTVEVIQVQDASDEDTHPLQFRLNQNYPNPFNPATNITFSLPHSGEVKLKIYDLLGRELATLVNEKKEPGEYSVQWNAENVPSGVYYYRIITVDFVETRKMVLVR